MRFLVAPDKFKGSLAAREVAEHIAAGIRDDAPDAQIDILPVADGGEGTAEVIRNVRGGEWMTCAAQDALGRPIEARYVWLRDSAIAVIEMSAAAGIWRITPPDRDVMRANTFGVGQMLRAAVECGAREIIIGLGGSATNDGGLGMARALGFRFFANDQELRNGPADLMRLTRIVPSPESPPSRREGCGAPGEGNEGALNPIGVSWPRIVAAADVRSPLLGERGATRIFGPQKGATPEQIELLECALTKLAGIVHHDLGSDFQDESGAGAAGGLGFGLANFCGAELRSGFEVVAAAIGLEERMRHSDIVITGEGRLDAQTLEGKAPAGVAACARKLGKRVYAIVGEDGTHGGRGVFDDVLELVRAPITSAAARDLAAALLRERAAELVRILRT